MRKFIFILILLCLFHLLVFSSETEREPNIFVFFNASTGDVDLPTREYYNKFVAEYLFREGFNAIIIENESEVSELINTAVWLGAFFLLEINYSEKIEVYQLVFNGYSTWNGDLIVSEGQDIAIGNRVTDYETLSKIITVLNQFLETEEVKILLAELEETTITVPEPETESIPDPEPLLEVPLDGQVPSEPEIMPVKNSDIESSTINRIQFSVNSAPFISTLATTEYFTTGWDVSLSGIVRFEWKDKSLEAGGMMKLMSFDARGSSAFSKNKLWTLGLTGRLGTGDLSFIDSSLRLTAGMSLLTIELEENESMSKIIPFLSVGAGIQVPLSGNWGFTCAIDYNLYIEKSILITGFTPSLGLYYKL